MTKNGKSNIAFKPIARKINLSQLQLLSSGQDINYNEFILISRRFRQRNFIPGPNMQMLDTLALRKREFWIRVASEFFATTMFVFLVCGSTLNWQNSACTVLRISLTAGLSIATLAMAIGHLTGGLINPSVNVALMVTRKISIVEGIFYTMGQICGGRYILNMSCMKG